MDSILKYAKIVGIPPYEALGLSAAESTFYNSYLSEADEPLYKQNNGAIKIAPNIMNSDWAYKYNTQYMSLIEAVTGETDPVKKEKKALEGRKYMEKQAKKFKVNIPPLQHSLELYKSGRYNTGNKNYMNEVRRRGENLKNSPEMVRMVNNSKFR